VTLKEWLQDARQVPAQLPKTSDSVNSCDSFPQAAPTHEVDHVIAEKHGGVTTAENLVIMLGLREPTPPLGIAMRFEKGAGQAHFFLP
jgi:hypothetical protein